MPRAKAGVYIIPVNCVYIIPVNFYACKKSETSCIPQDLMLFRCTCIKPKGFKASTSTYSRACHSSWSHLHASQDFAPPRKAMSPAKLSCRSCMYACMCVCVCLCVFVCVYIYIYIHTHTHIYIHTQTDTYIHACIHMNMEYVRSGDSVEGGIGEWERVLRARVGKMQGLVSDRALPECLERMMSAIPQESQHQCAEAAASALDEMLTLRSECLFHSCHAPEASLCRSPSC